MCLLYTKTGFKGCSGVHWHNHINNVVSVLLVECIEGFQLDDMATRQVIISGRLSAP